MLIRIRHRRDGGQDEKDQPEAGQDEQEKRDEQPLTVADSLGLLGRVEAVLGLELLDFRDVALHRLVLG